MVSTAVVRTQILRCAIYVNLKADSFFQVESAELITPNMGRARQKESYVNPFFLLGLTLAQACFVAVLSRG